MAKIQVSGDGSVEDLVVIEASHVGLVDRAEHLIKRAKFRMPKEDAAGSVQFELRLPFHYPSDLGVSSISPSDDIRQVMSGFEIVEMSFKLHEPQYLDFPPKLVEQGQVFRPDDQNGKPITGSATVQFYINHRGEVCLPVIVASTHPEVARAAIGTVSDMKFTPPTVKGEASATIIQMPFSVK
ncbi:MAG: TonB family protein [Puniceicoccaceae bacterium]